MSQVTLSVLNEKLPSLQADRTFLENEDQGSQNTSSRPIYTTVSDSVKDAANYFFKTYLSWEYFSNELEFE